MKTRLYIVIFALIYSIVVAYPTIGKALRSKSGSDYASYHYAAHAVLDGKTPYSARVISSYAQKEKTRKRVHPFFYPPPATLVFLWSPFFSLSTSFAIFAAISNILWLACLVLLRKLVGASWILLAFVAVLFCPVSNSIRMGQVNLLVLFLMLFAVQRKSGGLISIAAMIKMSPAFIVFQWLCAGRLKAVVFSGVGVILLSLLALFVVDISEQYRFYSKILPTFSAGPYYELSIPITLPANHSIADIWNQLWPGPTNFELSSQAQLANSISIFTLLGGLCFLSFRTRKMKEDIPLTGAMIALMTVTPLYAYEHHLVFAVLPMVIVLHGIQTQSLSRKWTWLVAPAVVFLSITLGDLRILQSVAPQPLKWFLQESKFFAVWILGGLCAYLSYKSSMAWQEQTGDASHLPESLSRE